MKFPRIAAAVLLSLAVSGGCTLLVSRQISANTTRAAATVSCVVATRDIDAGEVLKADDLKVVEWPQSLPLAGAFPRVNDLLGRATLSPLAKDQPLLGRDVSEAGSGAGLAARIPAGMRAISLRSDEVVGVGGFLNPGSRVDMLVTFHSPNSPEAHTATALQNAAVLAAGQKSEPDPSGKPATVTVVTLLLSPDDAERAVLASTQGTVHFVLRNGSDRVVTGTQPMQMATLTGEAPVVPHALAAHHRAAPAPDPVEMVLDGGGK